MKIQRKWPILCGPLCFFVSFVVQPKKWSEKSEKLMNGNFRLFYFSLFVLHYSLSPHIISQQHKKALPLQAGPVMLCGVQHYNLAESSLPALKRATFFALILITAPV